jgi:branched-subunit amino acid ABC-type transport system permease component
VPGDQFLSYAISFLYGISQLLLLSMGLAIIFGMRGIINLAHGEFVMLGAFASLSLYREGIPFVVSIPLAAIIVGAFGLVIERLLVRRLYGRLVDTMLLTWGLSLILVQVVVKQYGNTTEGIPTPLGVVRYGRFANPAYQFVIIGVTLAAVLATYLLMRHTRYGLFARASTQLPDMAASLGVNAARTNMWTFGLGAFLAGFAGSVLAPFLGISATMGQNFIGRAFLAVIVGGPQFLVGTAAGSATLGGVENIVSTAYSPVVGLVSLLLCAIVLIRFLPNGLTGSISTRRSQ